MRERKIFVLFLHTSASMKWILCTKINNFSLFLSSFSLWKVTLLSQNPYFTAHIKINYKTGCIGRISEKTRDVSRTMAASNLGLFVSLVIRFQPLTNFTKNPNIGVMGVLNNTPGEYYTYTEICAGYQIKHCRTVSCNFSKDNLFHRLMHCSNSSSICICISHPIIYSTRHGLSPWFFMRASHIQSLSKTNLLTFKFSGSYWNPSFTSTIVKPFHWKSCYLFVVDFTIFFLT